MTLALEIDPRELADIRAALDERPEMARRALVRTINKVLASAVSQGLRAIAAADAIPLKVLRGSKAKGRRGRGIVRRAVRGNLTGIAWFGTNPIKAGYLGTPRRTAGGARVGQHVFPGSFVATMPSGHVGIFHRAGRARLPIVEEVVRLTAAPQAIDGIKRRIPERLAVVFNQEMNYELNVRGRA